MGNVVQHLVSAQESDVFIQTFLRPFEGCQKQIEEAVNTICTALQETEEFPLVTGVAKVSGGLGSRLLGARDSLATGWQND